MRQIPSLGRMALAQALWCCASAVAVAQAPTNRPATHTVKKGDTLWDLAKTYLGDAFQWPQIWQLNKELIKDPHWIYPNQTFKIPGGTLAANAPAAGAGGAGATGQVGQQRRPGNMTVFNPQVARDAERNRKTILTAAAHTAVRPGDYLAAPYMWLVGGPGDGGKLDGTAEPIGSGMTVALRPIQQQEEVLITVPRGVTASEGTKLLVYRLGPVIPGQGQVVVPTGVVRVITSIDATRARARLTQKFEDVFAGHGVTALEPLSMPVNVFPKRVEFGLATHIAWIYTEPVLPGSGAQMILAVGAGAGLVPGDQVSLRHARAGDDAGTAPDAEIGVAQITRVTPWGASALVIDAGEAGIMPGVRAQVSAKMP